jgi:ATP-dependent Clp protease adaptor protein ClpS
MIFEPGIEEELDVLIKEVTEKTKVIILYNDDYNTFDHVINCLLKYCDHNPIQAEQCALLVHHNGKCDVKHGSYDKLKPVCEALLEQGLTAKIE